MPTEYYSFRNLEETDWIHKNLTSYFHNLIMSDCPWELIFIATTWNLWTNRNKALFSGVNVPVKLCLENIKLLVADLMTILDGSQSKTTHVVPDQMWSKPPHSWVKMNTDGSVVKEKNSASAGGLLRDDNGNWIVDFTSHLGDCSIIVAELVGLRTGLEIAWDTPYQ